MNHTPITNRTAIVFILLTVSVAFGMAQSSAETIAVRFFGQSGTEKILAVKFDKQAIVLNNQTLATLFYNQSGYIAVSNSKQYPPVLAYATKGFKQSNLTELTQFILLLYGNYTKAEPTVYEKQWDAWITGTSVKQKSTETPLVSSLFGQVNCHDENNNVVNVGNLYTPNHVAPGCVAVSLATVVHYNKWPRTGTGSKTYTDNYGSLRGEHAADFENITYDWFSVKDKYNYVTSTTAERQAYGKLAYYSAIALEMDFENGGSTANVRDIPAVLNNYFRHFGVYKKNTGSSFFEELESDLDKGSPVVFAVASANGSYKHSIVCDGWKTDDTGDKFYHLNMGWWSSSNGWYKLSDEFNAGGYSVVEAAVFGIVPLPELNLEYTDQTLSLSWNLPETQVISGYVLQVKIGRARWADLAEGEAESFDYLTEPETSYAFRVRAKYDKFPDSEAWSAMEVFDTANPTSINLAQKQAFTLYPNPVSDRLFIDGFKPQEISTITVYDLLGRKRIVRKLEGKTNVSIYTANLPKGVYKVSMGSSTKEHKTIIKQ